MGGEGRRFANPLPKQFQVLDEKAIYLHTLETFLSIDLIDEIFLVTHPDYLNHVSLAEHHGKVTVIPGGNTRQESSFNGVLACDHKTDYVIIHDAVRPFITRQIILDNLSALEYSPAVDTCIPSADTIIHTVDQKKICDIPIRSEYWRGQTPQSFHYSVIKEAHLLSKTKEAVDDCSLVLAQGHPVTIVRGSEVNIKITSQVDLITANALRKAPVVSSAPTRLSCVDDGRF